MLRDPNALPPRPPSRFARVAAVGTLAAAALAVAGLRGPDAAQAQAPPGRQATPGLSTALDRPAAAPAPDVFDLSHVPAEASLVLVARPAALLARPGFEAIGQLFDESRGNGKGSLNLPPKDVEGLVLMAFLSQGPGGGPATNKPPTLLLRATKPQDWKAVAGDFITNSEVVANAPKPYVRAKGTSGQFTYAILDDRTILFGPEDDVNRVTAALVGPKVGHTWDGVWSKLKKGEVALAFDVAGLATLMPKDRPGGPPLPLGPFQPLLQDTTAGAAGLTFDRGTSLEAFAATRSDEAAQRVHETAGALIVLSKNTIPSLRERLGGKPGRPELLLFDLAEPLLKGAKAEVVGHDVKVSAHTDTEAGAIVQMFLPAVLTARAAARRAQSINNLKQIGLAMHNYHDPNNQFPPAVLTLPNARASYSWRVALLPYIGEGALYNEYRFDEAWDGPNNRKLIERMPAIYGHPGDDRAKGNTAYFVVSGPETLFPPGGPGTPIHQITDGTSNTILAVEAKRDVPWTKPDDIPYDTETYRKGVGPAIPAYTDEGTVALFADGSVRFLSSRVNPQVMAALFSRAGGEVISADALGPIGPQPAEPAPQPPPGGLTPTVTPPR